MNTKQYRRWHKHPYGTCSCGHLYAEHYPNGCTGKSCSCKLKVTEKHEKVRKEKQA